MSLARRNLFQDKTRLFLSVGGVDYYFCYFCAKGCRDEFANDAERFLAGKEASLR